MPSNLAMADYNDPLPLHFQWKSPVCHTANGALPLLSRTVVPLAFLLGGLRNRDTPFLLGVLSRVRLECAWAAAAAEEVSSPLIVGEHLGLSRGGDIDLVRRHDGTWKLLGSLGLGENANGHRASGEYECKSLHQ